MPYEIKKNLIGWYSVKYECPHCAEQLTSAIAEAGTVQECPTCLKALVVPGKEESVEIEKAEIEAAEQKKHAAEIAFQAKLDRIEEKEQAKREKEANRRRPRFGTTKRDQDLIASAVLAPVVFWILWYHLFIGSCVILFCVWIWSKRPQFCDVCGNGLKRNAYYWTINGARTKVCPHCNRTFERRQSSKATANIK